MTDRPLTLERPASLPSSRRALEFARGLWDLTKPGIIGLLLVTTVPTMIVAADGWPKGSFGEGLVLILLTLLGGILTAGGANTFNQWFDRDIDAIMERTAGRPLPAGVVQPWQALAWGVVLATLGGIQLALTVNLLAALLAEAAVLFYVLVYTVWLKRSTTQNIVIGGAAGSIPPLVGWAAVTGEVTWTPFILFLVIFMWTPPHFWALALKYREDYARADVPMLPVVSGERETRKQLMIYSVGLVTVSLLGPLGGHLSWCYLTTCAISGAAFIWIAWQVWRNQAPPMRLFFASIAYLFIVFAAVGLDVLV